ncbi:MAG: hypothetical protein V7752_14340 [Halopseudomonas sp.]
MKKYLLAVWLISSLVSADTLELNNGKTFEGKLVGKDGDSIQFESDGIAMTFNASDVKNLSMGSTAAAPSAAPAANDSASGEKPEVPAGTRLVVKLGQPLDTNRVKEGHKFTAALESAIVIDGVTIASSGTAVYGVIHESKSSGRLVGQSSMLLSLTDIKVDDQMKSIKTSGIQAVSENTAKNTAGKTARAAVIGGLADGKSGARTGAKVGGAASILSRGEQVVIPAGTLFEFTLAENVKL